MPRSFLVLFSCLLCVGSGIGQVVINEIDTGAPDSIELRNLTDELVDVSGWELRTFTGVQGNPTFPDPVFVMPSGTFIGANGFLVVREGSVPPTGPPADTLFTSFNYPFLASSTVEVVLTDSAGNGRDYVIREQFLGAPSTSNRPADLTFSGTLDEPGEVIARIHSHDTNSANDWHSVNGIAPTLGQPNPVQLGGGNPHERLMITEISWGNRDGLEITNFTKNPIDLTGWTVRWRDTNQVDSQPLDTVIDTGEIIIVRETGTFTAPPGVQDLIRFPALSTTSQAFTVTLFDPNGIVADEVGVTSDTGAPPTVFFGRRFEGTARRGVVTGVTGFPSVERTWGMDSENGGDWTEQLSFSFGLENLGSGLRTAFSGLSVPEVRISEIDPGASDYVELFNAEVSPTNLEGWFLLLSAGQGQDHVQVFPFPSRFLLPAGGFVVIGDGAPPAELPAGATYVDVSSTLLGGQNLGLSLTNEYSLGLYTEDGDLVDLVRATRAGGVTVHNHPRTPSQPFDFRGAVFRISTADSMIARLDPTGDSDQGTDWAPTLVRTMGSPNTGFAAPVGAPGPMDVRLNQTGLGQGLTMLLNAGPQFAFRNYQVFFSGVHSNGVGPFFGLGADAAAIAEVVFGVSPFAGTLNSQGAARILDVPPGAAAPGLGTDNVVFLFDPLTFQVIGQTQVLEFDTDS